MQSNDLPSHERATTRCFSCNLHVAMPGETKPRPTMTSSVLKSLRRLRKHELYILGLEKGRLTDLLDHARPRHPPAREALATAAVTPAVVLALLPGTILLLPFGLTLISLHD